MPLTWQSQLQFKIMQVQVSPKMLGHYKMTEQIFFCFLIVYYVLLIICYMKFMLWLGKLCLVSQILLRMVFSGNINSKDKNL